MVAILESQKIERSVDEIQLEELTKKYLLGEIELDRYRYEISRLRVRLDLRRMASKVKTGALVEKLENPT